MKARQKLSTAFHLQTDRQTERQNQTLEHYLRCYINYRQDDWVEWLPQAKFVYNNAAQASMGRSPFYAMYAYNPSFTWDVDTEVPECGTPVAHERATTIKVVRDELTQHLRAAGEYQTKYYNQRHKPRHFNIRDEVLLSSKNICLVWPSKKLDNCFLGPFKILEVVRK